MSLFIPPDYFRELRSDEIFADAGAALEVDLGCGDGSFFAAMADHYPDRRFLGVERMLGRVVKSSRKINRAGLTNARVMRLESSYSVACLLPTAGVARLHLLCPDPWPKAKHKDRRLINQEDFLAGLERILACGGEFLLKTDDPQYFDDALTSLSSRPAFERVDWPADAFFYPPTDFEQHWVNLCREIHRARWRRVPRHVTLHGEVANTPAVEVRAAA